MITKERIEELKRQGVVRIWYANGKVFGVQNCTVADWDSRYPHLFFETEEEAIKSTQK